MEGSTLSVNTSAASGVASNASGVILVGRILLSILFILAGFGKLTAIAGTAGFFGSLGLPAPTVTAVIVGLIELLGGDLVNVFEVMKRDEIERYAAEVPDPTTRDVTPWEVREYFLDL